MLRGARLAKLTGLCREPKLCVLAGQTGQSWARTTRSLAAGDRDQTGGKACNDCSRLLTDVALVGWEPIKVSTKRGGSKRRLSLTSEG